MKRFLVSILVLTFILGMVGCSGQNGSSANATTSSEAGITPSESTQPSTAATDGNKKVVLWTWIATQQKAIDQFNAMQSDIKVELVQMVHTDIAQKMLIAIAAGQGAPDIFQQPQRNFSNISKTGKLMDLTAAYEPYKDKFSEAVTGLLTVNNKIYGMAPDICPGVLWYRKDIFEKSGIGQIATWSDFEAAGVKLKEKGYYIMPIFNPAGSWGANAIALFLQSRGGNFFTSDGKVIENNAELEYTLEWFNKMLDSGLAEGLTFFTPEFWGEFKANKIVTWPMNIAEGNDLKINMPEQSGKWDVLPFPKWDDKSTNYTGCWGGTALGIPDMSEAKEEALQYIEWLCTTTEGQKAMYSSWGSVPSNQDALTDDYFKNGEEFFGGTNPLAQVKEMPAFYYHDFSTVESVVGEQVDLMFADKQDPTTTARNIEKGIKEATGR